MTESTPSDPSEAGKLPKWLRQLQDASWYPEIVISLGAIFSLLSLSDSLIHLGNQLKFSAAYNGLDGSILVFMVAIKGITIGFFFHIILRAFWISLLCLNFAFPDGINFSNFKIKGPYESEARQVVLLEQIKKLDVFSGLTFFASILFVIASVGLLLVIAFVFYPANFMTDWFGWSDSTKDAITMVLAILAVIFYLDFLTAGMLRKSKWTMKIFYPFYFIFNTISLAIVFRSWTQILFSNINKWRAFAFSIVFISATFIYSNIALGNIFYWKTILENYQFPPSPQGGVRTNSLYDDQIREGEFIFMASIPSDIIQNNHLRLFVPYRSHYSDGIIKSKGEFFSDIVEVSINDSTLTHLNWMSMRHKTTNQLGIVTRIPIAWLPSGEHRVLVKINDDWRWVRQGIKIMFWKD
ncbi:MAG: hypothetical protein L0Y35_01955 [Flammeovirgaceae bacterium]|nr:hypothetical protein [Flammeovirgaceae bacterium]